MPLNQQFYATVRRTLYAHGLPQSAVNAMEAIYAEAVSEGITSSAQFAYVLATVYGEAGEAMLPVPEIGRGLNKKYGYPGVVMPGSKLVVPPECLHIVYYGRGWPQLTWYDNYLKLQQKTKLPLTTQPDLMLVPKVSAEVLIVGMRDGLFTGHKLADYFAPGVGDWVGARHIINGQDKAETFAAHAKLFYNAMQEGGVSLSFPNAPAVASKPAVTPAKTTAQIDTPRRGLIADILSWFGKKWG